MSSFFPCCFLSDYLYYYHRLVPNNGMAPRTTVPADAITPSTQTTPGGAMTIRQRDPIFGLIFKGFETAAHVIGKAIVKKKAKKLFGAH
jgi:hypothetical protein